MQAETASFDFGGFGKREWGETGVCVFADCLTEWNWGVCESFIKSSDLSRREGDISSVGFGMAFRDRGNRCFLGLVLFGRWLGF